jgi:adenylate kinase family enzyme
MYYDLTKAEKKIDRMVMDKGPDVHYRRSLEMVDEIISRWKSGGYEDNRKAYMEMFKTVDKNDDRIADVYNNKGGSRYVEIMAMQLADGVITEEDLSEFSERTREVIMFLAGKR